MAKKKNKKSKAKRQKFIAKISSDGKISKKEGQKAAKKGISLRKIQNRRVSDYRKSTRDFDRRGGRDRSPAAKRPTYEPLKIKRGAERADFARQMREYGGSTQQSRRPRRGGGGGGESSAPAPYQSPFADKISDLETKLQGYMDQPAPEDTSVQDAISALEQTIAGFQMPDFGDELETMRAEQERYMQELADRQAEAEREREFAFRTSQENAARGGMTADFRIGARSPRDRMGTGGFKRRPRRRAAVAAQGITPTSSAAYNAHLANPNTAEARGINLAAINRAPVGYSKV